RRADHAARPGPAGHRRPRPVGAAGRGVRRRVAGRRHHADVRGEVRHRGARGLRDDRDRELVLVQPAGRPEGAVHRQADVGGADAGRRYPGPAAAAGRDHVGEIWIRGHNVMKGYLGRPEATAETLRGGWLHSGDLGYMDSDGFYFIVDRAKDLVIRGGFNVYPREIEEVLYAHPAIL